MAFSALAVIAISVFAIGCSDQAAGLQPVTTAQKTAVIGQQDNADLDFTAREGERNDRVELVLPCLKLTADQMAKLREFAKAKADCEKPARDAFRAALEPLRQQQKATIDSIRGLVKSGAMTAADGRKAIEAANKAIGEQIKAAEAAMKAAIQPCNEKFLADIASILNADQKALWDQWRATGVIPCDRRGGGRDSLGNGRGPGGGRDTIRKDTVRRSDRVESILPCLKLTEQQAVQMRGFDKARQDCEKAARAQFETSMNQARKEQKETMDAINAQVRAGTITRDEARKQSEAATKKANDAIRAAQEAMNAAMKNCYEQYLANIESILTADQKVIWIEWRRTGVIPCNGTGPTRG